jgi:hypothetical protein
MINADNINGMFTKLLSNTFKYYPNISASSAKYSTTQYVAITTTSHSENMNISIENIKNVHCNMNIMKKNTTNFVWYIIDSGTLTDTKDKKYVTNGTMDIPYFLSNENFNKLTSLSTIIFDDINMLSLDNLTLRPDLPLIYDYTLYKNNKLCDKLIYIGNGSSSQTNSIDHHISLLYFENSFIKKNLFYNISLASNVPKGHSIYWIKWEDVKPRYVKNIITLQLYDKLPYVNDIYDDTSANNNNTSNNNTSNNNTSNNNTSSNTSNNNNNNNIDDNKSDTHFINNKSDTHFIHNNPKKHGLPKYTCSFSGLPIYDDCYVIDIYEAEIIELINVEDKENNTEDNKEISTSAPLHLNVSSFWKTLHNLPNNCARLIRNKCDNKYVVSGSTSTYNYLGAIDNKIKKTSSRRTDNIFIHKMVKFNEPIHLLVSDFMMKEHNVIHSSWSNILNNIKAKYIIYRTFCPTTRREVIDKLYISNTHKAVLYHADEKIYYNKDTIIAGKNDDVILVEEQTFYSSVLLKNKPAIHIDGQIIAVYSIEFYHL